jgi:hypothetical protein
VSTKTATEKTSFVTKQYELKLHGLNRNSNYRVKFEYQVTPTYFAAQFEVQKLRGAAWIIPPPKTYELWNFDVVEVFLQWRKDAQDIHAPYLEFELSADEQQLGLVIFRPRVQVATLWNYTFTSQAQVEPHLWHSQMTLPWPGQNEGFLYGGAFSCLGQGPDRQYFSLNPNPESRPDFHRPELFIPL